MMKIIESIARLMPEVVSPTQKHLGFSAKLKWTLVTLVAFFVLGVIPLWGLDPNSQFQFAQLELILGASFGSIISLGIGPIVTASIVLQLLQGSGIIKLDQRTPEGKKKYQSVQKVSSLFFVIFEAFIYVFMGGLTPPAGAANFFVLELFLVFQLFLGGLLIMWMDEVITKWGFGSGISLFIAAGVSKEIFVRALSPFRQTVGGVAGEGYVGAIPELFRTISVGDTTGATLALGAIVATIVIFLAVVFTQAMKVEIPLSFGRIRGHGIRWPLSFFYTSNIPVILVAALFANFQLWARLMQNWASSSSSGFVLKLSQIVGSVDSGGNAVSGLVQYVTPPNILRAAITNSITLDIIFQAIVYIILLTAGAVLFSYFWVQTAGLDSRSQAKNIMQSGLQVPGFRKDPRVLERLLDRYIMPLTIMGGIAVGLLSALADVTGTLTSGTGLLLAVMIIYRLYEDVAKEQVYGMNPMMRKFLGKE